MERFVLNLYEYVLVNTLRGFELVRFDSKARFTFNSSISVWPGVINMSVEFLSLSLSL